MALNGLFNSAAMDESLPQAMDTMNQLALGPLYVPRDPGPVATISAGAAPIRSPFNASEPVGGRSLPTDNYRQPLSNYAPTLYRQANPNEVPDYIPGMRTTDKTNDAPFFADHPSVALGQGGNANGVMLAFDPSGIHGQINTGKPSFEPSWRSGYGEYRGTNNGQDAYQQALIGLRIPTGLQMSRLDARQMQTATDRLKAAGWISQDGPGYVEYLRPSNP